jgi:hypothetical protein
MTEEAVQEHAPVAEKQKAKGPTNIILDVATEVEGLTKVKALKMARHLSEDIELNYFRLGGVLKVIYTNAWFEGFESFDLFVYENFGFQARKAQYLMSIYDNLVTKQIPWEKVAHLGWTKLKDLAPVLTLDNVDDWVAKATPCTVVQLQAMLKATMPAGDGASTSTTSDVSVIKFKLKNDQIETVNAALASVKAQIGTDHDNVALEALCSAHLAGVGGAVKKADIPLVDLFTEVGFEAVLNAFDTAFPKIDISVDTSKLDA